MKRNNRLHTLFISATLAAWAVSVGSCNDPRTYNHYEHTDLNGWERNDTLTFDIPRSKHNGKHQEWVGLRVYKDFPFKKLSLVVSQTIFPSKLTVTDTIECPVIGNDGLLLGKRSLNYTEIRKYLREINLKADDSIHIAVIHHMRQEIIPGVSDVGIEIKK